ncbi:MAG TPA: hypothetical protein VEB43_15355 [Anaeromyxobacter sp.]|nr:hypothetical protein [Anaeromyxobacter sp.]
MHPPKLAVLLALLAPLATAAQTTQTPQPAETPPQQPAETPPQQPAKPPPFTVELGGWLSLTAWSTLGAVNASDLPRFALADEDERGAGLSVKQSRLRVKLGLPGDGGLLGGATLQALVEADFAGGFAGGDEAAALPRLRHAYVSATWKELGNLQVLAGQTTDVFHGSVGAVSLGHVATPRFSGAGYLHRRAPQLRVQGELGGDLALGWQVAALSPADRTTQTASSTSVGYRSFAPDLEARLAFLLRGASPVKVELGVGGRWGHEKWRLAGAPGAPDAWVKSQAVAADLKVEAGWFALVGGAYTGENLDGASSLTPGVRTTATGGDLTSVKSIPTRGAWGQLQLTPVRGLQLLAGAGVEAPDEDLLPATISAGTTPVPAIARNLQLSAGAIVNLTAKWRAGLELTRYETRGVDDHTSRSDQVELSTLFPF